MTHLDTHSESATPVNSQPKAVDGEAACCMAALGSRDARARSAAASRLGELGQGGVALVSALLDRNPYVRTAAAKALGRSGAECPMEAADALLAAIHDSSDHVSAAAILSLGQLRHSDAASEIAQYLQASNPHIVIAAVRALGLLKATEYAEPLESFLTNDDTRLQSQAVEALLRMEHSSAAPRILELLEQSLRVGSVAGSNFVILHCMKALARFGTTEAAELLVEVALTRFGLRTHAVQALIRLRATHVADRLLPLLSDSGTGVRASTMEMMRIANCTVALPFIRRMLQDSNLQLRSTALSVVTSWCDAASIQGIRWLCHNERHTRLRAKALRCLTELHQGDAERDLVALLSDDALDVRLAAAESLVGIGLRSSDAAARVRGWLVSEDEPEVRRHLIQALDAWDSTRALKGEAHVDSDATVPPKTPCGVDAAILREHLGLWLHGLRELRSSASSEDVHVTDQALAHLISTLDGVSTPLSNSALHAAA